MQRSRVLFFTNSAIFSWHFRVPRPHAPAKKAKDSGRAGSPCQSPNSFSSNESPQRALRSYPQWNICRRFFRVRSGCRHRRRPESSGPTIGSAVDVCCAEIVLLRHAQRLVYILGKDGAEQAVSAHIHLAGDLLVLKTHQRQHRPKGFVGMQHAVHRHMVYHGRSSTGPWACLAPFAAGYHPGTLFPPPA